MTLLSTIEIYELVFGVPGALLGGLCLGRGIAFWRSGLRPVLWFAASSIVMLDLAIGEACLSAW
jgi:hypothetical protein